MEKKQNTVFGLLIGGAVFILIGGVFFFAVGKPAIDLGKASTEWPTVDATVVRSKVVTSSSDKKTMYSADVAYKYSVNDREYESNVVRFGGDLSSSNSSGAYRIVDEYPQGTTITVRYNPEEPEVATIKTGTHMFGHIAWWVGIGMMLLGAYMVVVFFAKIILGVGIIAGAAAGVIGKSPGSHGNTDSSRDRHQTPNFDDNEPSRDYDATDDDDGISLH